MHNLSRYSTYNKTQWNNIFKDRQTDRYRDRQTESWICARSPATIVCENMKFLQSVLERLEII